MKINGLQYTGASISLVLDARPICIEHTHSAFQDVLAIVREALGTGTIESTDVAERIDNAIRKYEKVAKSLAVPGTGVEVVDERVLIHGEEVTGFVAERLISIVDQAEQDEMDPIAAIQPLATFLERLLGHPWNSEAAGYHERALFTALKEDLYRFLEKGKMPLTGDGCFLAYKAIDGDWYSIHAGNLRGTTGTVVRVNGAELDCTSTPATGHGTIRNQVGDAPRIPLNMVNPNRDETCSHGLHVCSFDYLPHFSHANGHVVLCKVAPEDVGSIPADYNDTKMRVCAYSVVAEYADYYTVERANWGAVTSDFDEAVDENLDMEEEDDPVVNAWIATSAVLQDQAASIMLESLLAAPSPDSTKLVVLLTSALADAGYALPYDEIGELLDLFLTRGVHGPV